MGVPLQLSHSDQQIQFLNKEYGIMGFTDYTPVIWEELSKVNWYVDEKKFVNDEKTYIYTGSNHFGERKSLHQIVMKLWYGEDALDAAYIKKYIVEHHNNMAFDCQIKNLSFASNDLNLTKAHSFDKTQPRLLQQAAVNFYKDFKTQQYQITIAFTGNFTLVHNKKSICIERLYLVYDNNFRVVYTDANRIVDELLEASKIDFKLLSYKYLSYKEAEIYIPKNDEEIKGIQFSTNEQGEPIMIVGKEASGKIFFNSIPPNQELFNKKYEI
ncbi:hypothetical protein [Sporosarcina sp. P1]|uniref:hypothetical protein n=1 Tax=Sporosarcina sp. P1 TaxID=2048257 RepID=UPI000C163F70|nr:hypothetical protein [Sporosarcina sp. P1]PIC83305.1 hypothetical protein CSV73_08630 [Sporosarcina sp. P1]